MRGFSRSELKRAVIGILPLRLRVRVTQQLWNRLNRESEYGFISHLRSGDWDADEFATVGERFVDQMMARYEDYASVSASEGTALEIGCGVGRFLKPLSERFAAVIGVDFSEAMLDTAREYTLGLSNISLRQNDGVTLEGIPDRSVDFVVSAGVFQHITAVRVVGSYIREGLRVTKPGGLVLFQFEGNRTADVGRGQVGARITASALDHALEDQSFRIREVSSDPRDPIRNVVCVLERTEEPSTDRFATYPMTERPWLHGVYDGVATDTEMHARLATQPLPLTFYDA